MYEDEYKRIFSKNLNKYMEINGKNQIDIINDLGFNKSAVSTWCNGTRLPRMDKVDALARYFNINRSDLIEEHDDYSNKSFKPNRIPVLGSVPAGVPIEAIEDVLDWEDIPMDWLRGGKEYFALKVQGDSMFPKYIEGDTIIVRKECDCESGQDCIVYVNGYDATLKKVIKKKDCIILQPLNPSYDPKVYNYNDEFNPISIAGVVVEIRRTV